MKPGKAPYCLFLVAILGFAHDGTVTWQNTPGGHVC